jgi:hypothetical protein
MSEQPIKKRNNNGTFVTGNNEGTGRPKGTPNKTTKQIREFLTNFLHDKSFEMAHIWDSLDDKDKATMYLHICRLVLPKQQEEEPLKNELNTIQIEIVRPSIEED